MFFILLLLIIPSDCASNQPVNYTIPDSTSLNYSQKCVTLSFKKCTICYRQDPPSQNLTLTSCTFKECLFNEDQCKTQITGQLLTPSCMKTCCMFPYDRILDQTTLNECINNDYGLFKAKKQEIEDKKPIKMTDGQEVMLTFSLIVLSLVFSIFLVCLFCYCYQNRPGNQIVSAPCEPEAILEVQWSTLYDFQQSTMANFSEGILHANHLTEKCRFCKEPNPNCKTFCGHKFHVLCLRKNKLSHFSLCHFGCPLCQSTFLEPVKIVCQICRNRSFQIKNISLKDNLQRILHYNKIYCQTCYVQHLASGSVQSQGGVGELVEEKSTI